MAAPRSTPRVGSPSLQELLDLGEREPLLRPSQASRRRVVAGYARLRQLLAEASGAVYGTTTHFGANVGQAVLTSWEAHQENLIEFLQAGTGPAFPQTVVRRALRLQVHKLAHGLSGVSPECWDDLVVLSNAAELPEVPAFGSLGASGDLIPMAHAVGEMYRSRPRPGPRDGLALVNTNAFMLSTFVELVARASQLADAGAQISGQMAWALACHPTQLDPIAVGVGRPSGCATVAAAAQIFAAYQEAANGAVAPSSGPQARYSLRCAPQIIGALRTSLARAEAHLGQEAYRVADNPVLGTDALVHGARFYTVELADHVDLLGGGLVRLLDMIDRQVHLAVTPDFSSGLPANLVMGGRHLKGEHQCISALLQSVRSQALPSVLLATPAESYNQDVLPATLTRQHAVTQILSLGEQVIAKASRIAEQACQLRRESVLGLR